MSFPSPDVIEVLEATPSLTEASGGFSITLPHDCYADAHLTHEDSQTIATINYIHVPTDLRNHGIGGRLMEGLFRHAADTDVDIVRGYVGEPEALHVRQRLLGEQAMHFIEVVDGQETELPMTFDQACATYSRLKEMYAQLARLGIDWDEDEDADHTLRVDVRMNEIDCSGWEAPVSHTPSTPSAGAPDASPSELQQHFDRFFSSLSM